MNKWAEIADLVIVNFVYTMVMAIGPSRRTYNFGSNI